MLNFELTEKDYIKFSRLIYEKCGINIHSGKKELLKARLSKVLRRSQFNSIKEYYDFLVNDASGQALIVLLDTISTNLTFFFREMKHFEFLTDTALPELVSRKAVHKSPLNIWCAGCSSGEEAYSIAITLLEYASCRQPFDYGILASDISTVMLRSAERGVYAKEKTREMTPDLVKRHFQKGFNKWEGYYKIKEHVRKNIEFQRINLMEIEPGPEKYDIIFCRNVMIYFDKKTQEKLIDDFFHLLAIPGYLFIGHSESLTGIKHQFKYIQPSVFKKS